MLYQNISERCFSIFYEKKSTKVDFSPILKSFCFFLITLRSIINLTNDFKSPLLDIKITIAPASKPTYFLFCAHYYTDKEGNIKTNFCNLCSFNASQNEPNDSKKKTFSRLKVINFWLCCKSLWFKYLLMFLSHCNCHPLYYKAL